MSCIGTTPDQTAATRWIWIIAAADSVDRASLKTM
jgi:hypothetical protein